MFDVNKTDMISGEGLATEIILDEEESQLFNLFVPLSFHVHFAELF